MFPLLFVSGMTYSQSNYQTCSSFPCDSMNVFWNSKMMEMMTRPMLYSYQSYDYNNFMPYQYNFGFDLLNPANFAQQWMNQNQGQYQYNMGTNWGGIPYAPGYVPVKPDGDSSKDYTKAEKRELNDLEAILKAYKNITKIQARKDLIEEALETRYAERLEALHKAYKEIPEADIKKTLMVMQENKVELEKTGYAFGGDYSYKNDNDTELKKNIISIHGEIEALKDYKYKSKELEGAIAIKDDILRLISYWNDEYNSKEKRSIINFVFNKLPEDAGDKKAAFNNNVIPLVTALVNKAIDVADVCENDSTVAKIENAKKQLNDATEEGLTNKANIIKAFEELYVILRKAEAERMNEEFKNKYEFLNDIDSDDTDIITKNLIIEDTEKDLAKEFKNDTTILTSAGVVNGDDDGNDDVKVKTTAFDYGRQVSRCMTKGKTSSKNETANEALGHVTEENVVDFLKGLYSDKKRNYFRRMDKRSGITKSGTKLSEISFEKRKELMGYVLKAAEKAGINTDNADYKKLKDLYTAYTTGYKKDCTDFKEKGWFLGASDGRKIGRYIRRLYKDIDAVKGTVETETTDVQA